MEDYSDIAEEHRDMMTDAVKNTAARLDELIPDWRSYIDWDSFEFVSYTKCIYGQLKDRDQVPKDALEDCRDFGGFDVSNEIQNFYRTTYAVRVVLWDFMGQEWRKIAGRELTTTDE